MSQVQPEGAKRQAEQRNALQTERSVHLTYVPCSPRLSWLDGLRVLPTMRPRTKP